MAVRSAPLTVATQPAPARGFSQQIWRWLGQSLLVGGLLCVPQGAAQLQAWRARLHLDQPPTAVVRATVGHSDGAGQPTTLIALNVDRQVLVMELPGGDPQRTKLLVGPYLIGAAADTTAVEMSVADQTGDGRPDLVVLIDGEALVYVNDGAAFRPSTPAERAAWHERGLR